MPTPKDARRRDAHTPAGDSEATLVYRLPTTPQEGEVELDQRLAALLAKADGSSLDDLIAAGEPGGLTPLALRASLACLVEAGLLERSGPAERSSSPSAPTDLPVSAVLAPGRGSRSLEPALSSLLDQTHRLVEVIVVDDAPEGERDGRAAPVDSRVRFVSAPPGASKARRVNCGIEASAGECVLVVDGDVRLERDAVAELGQVAATDQQCAAVVPKHRRRETPGFLAGIGTRPEPGGFSDNAAGHLDLGQWDGWTTVPAARLAVALVRRSAWHEVGPLDERLSALGDLEWCSRARAVGHRVRVAPRAVVYGGGGDRSLDGDVGPNGDPAPGLYAELRFALKLLALPEAADFVRSGLRRRRATPGGAGVGRARLTRAWGSAWASVLRDLPELRKSRRRLGGRRASVAGALAECGLPTLEARLAGGRPRLTSLQIANEYAPLMKEGQTRPMPEFNETRRPVLVIVSQDIVDERMAGPGIRYLEMAKALSGFLDIVLAVPGETRLEVPGFHIVQYSEPDPASLQVLVDNADAAVVSGYMFAKFPFLATTPTRLAVDLYDPLVLENLHYYLGDPMEAQEALNRQAVEVMNAGIRLGDFFMCGTERQRDFWLGVLAADGRVNPRTFLQDDSLRRLVDVVGMGIPSRPPARGANLKGRDPRVPADARMVLWGGGVWNWLDPLTLVKAWPEVVAREPKARLVFLGTRHPNPQVPRHVMAERAETLAREVGELDRSIVFVEWVDLTEREALLCDAHVGVSFHPIHVETRYSIRARVIDYFWARLPVVVTEGDVASEWVERHGLGRVVPPHDVPAVERALLDVLARPRSSWSAAYDAIHEELSWERAVEPLRRYCLDGSPPAADRVRARAVPPPAPAAPPLPLPLRALHVWRTEGAAALLRRSLGFVGRRAGRVGAP